MAMSHFRGWFLGSVGCLCVLAAGAGGSRAQTEVAQAPVHAEMPVPGNETGAGDAQELPMRDPFETALPRPESKVSAVEISPGTAGEWESQQEMFDYSSLVVSGTVWGTDNPKAIINGNVMGKGETVNEAEIIDISKQGILFRYKGTDYLMRRPSAVLETEGENEENKPVL